MGTMTRSDIAKQLAMTITGVFGEYRDRPTEWSQVFDQDTMDRAVDEEVLMTGTGLANIKPEGQGVNYDTASESYVARYEAITIALAIAITEEAIEDNLWTKLGSKAGIWLERSLRNTKEILAANVLNYATDVTRPIGDGQPLLSTTHPTKGGANQSNTLALASDISESSIEDLLILVRKMQDDRGMVIGLLPRRLIIPPDQEYVVTRLLNSKQRTGTTDNDINAINYRGIFNVDPAVLTRLTSTTGWFIKTDAQDGLKMKQRVAVKVSNLPDFETGSVRSKARERYAVGVSDWRGIVGSMP